MAYSTSRSSVPALLLFTAALACGPKSDGNSDGSEDAGDETSGTSTGEALTGSGSNSDPSMPTASGTASSSAGTATATSATTTSAGSGEDPTATATATSIGTSATSATEGGDDTGFDPPPVIPCEGAGEPQVGITTTIAYLQSQVPPRRDPTGTGGSSGGGELDPGTLFVKFSDQAFTCDEPNASLECGQHWEVTIVIPPEFQSPGVFNLLGQDVHASAFETGAGADCSFGGGSFEATFQILAIDDQTVEGRLCNVNDLFFEADPQLEGTFSAARCPS